MSQLIAGQSIIVYAEPSRSIEDIIRKGDKHPVIQLADKHPGGWVQKLQMLPFLMKITVSVSDDLHFDDSHLARILQDVRTIVRDLPVGYRRAYGPIIRELETSTVETMDIPRTIEYLTMVSARYVFDCIDKDVEIKPWRRLRLEGLTLPIDEPHDDGGGSKEDRIVTSVWLFHNFRSADIDSLLMECLHLAGEKAKAVLAGRTMDILNILRIKCEKFHPVPPEERSRQQSNASRRLRRLLGTMDFFKKKVFSIFL